MINPKHIAILSFALFLTICSGCASEVDDPNFIFNIEDEFEIRLVEQLDPSGNQLALKVKSLLPNHCQDSKIVYNHLEADGEIIIRLNSITSYDNCVLSATAPSVDFLLSNPPSSNQNRSINITIQELVENQGDIKEYNDRFELNMNTLYGLRLDYRELLKMESTTLWGALDFNTEAGFNTAAEFLAEMNNVSVMSTLDPGYYGQFMIDADGDVTLLEAEHPRVYRMAFAFQSSKTLSELHDTLYDFRSNHTDMTLMIFNEQGESL